MEYKQLYLKAFEREPGKWRADIRRADDNPLKVTGRKKLKNIVTKLDATTAVAAMVMAMALIDAESFARDRAATEKFWRRIEVNLRMHGLVAAKTKTRVTHV